MVTLSYSPGPICSKLKYHTLYTSYDLNVLSLIIIKRAFLSYT